MECQIEYSHFTSHNKYVENTYYDYTYIYVVYPMADIYIYVYIYVYIAFSLDVWCVAIKVQEWECVM